MKAAKTKGASSGSPPPERIEAALELAAEQVHELLSQVNVAAILRKVRGDPTAYIRLVSALTKLGDLNLKREAHRAKSAAANPAVERSDSQGLTPETRKRIEAELKLM